MQRPAVTSSLLAVLSVLLLISTSTADETAQKSSQGDASARIRHWGEQDLVPSGRRVGSKTEILPGAVVTIDSRTKKIGSIRPVDGNSGFVIADAKSPQDAAEQFLKQHFEAIGVTQNLDDLQFLRSVDGIDLTVLHYRQTFHGVLVYGGSLRVSVRPSTLAVVGVSVELLPILRRNAVTHITSSDSAIRAVVADVDRRFPPQSKTRSQTTATKAILIRNGLPEPVWDVAYISGSGSWHAIVNATTNRVFSVRDQRRYCPIE